MKKQRMTIAIRKSIEANMKHALFNAPKEGAKAALKAAVMEAYNAQVPALLQECFDKHPKSVRSSMNDFQLATTSGGICCVSVDHPYPRIEETCTWKTIISRDSHPKFYTKALDKALTKYEKFRDGSVRFMKEAHGALCGYTTVQALVKAWPEVEKYLPPYVQDNTGNTLMVPVPVAELKRLEKMAAVFNAAK